MITYESDKFVKYIVGIDPYKENGSSSYSAFYDIVKNRIEEKLKQQRYLTINKTTLPKEFQ